MLQIKPWTRNIRTSALIGLVFLVYGCASYHDRIGAYYGSVASGNMAEAEQLLDKNALLNKPRNKLLLLMEKGRVAHLNRQFEKSNLYFNQADLLIEVGLKSTADAVVGTLLNPMSQNYKGEDFEVFMLHYYKALNYLYLGKTADALVEARRISLQTDLQGDKFNNDEARYSKDAFSLILQGLIYEKDKDFNNAFIAYRNAYEVYKNQDNQTYYGVKLPENLKCDLMRMCSKMGFTADLQKYEKEFGQTFTQRDAAEGELVVFWESGIAPIKVQQDLFFSLVKGANGSLFFTDLAGGLVIPFDFGLAGNSGGGLEGIQSLRVAYPKYVSNAPWYHSARISNSAQQVVFERVEDIDQLAIQTLKERSAKELGEVLTRLAVKKAAEYALSSTAKSADGNSAVLEGLGLGVQLFSLISEKADTRNWQTLPSVISYARIPLKAGLNVLDVQLKDKNGNWLDDQIEITATGGLQFYNYSTLK